MDRQQELKRAWLQLAAAAVAGYEAPEDLDDDDLVEDVANYAEAVADELLEAYEEAFPEGSTGASEPSRRRTRKERRTRRRKPAAE